MPKIYQLYPRNEADNDSATVVISGTVDNVVEYDSVTVDVKRNGTFWKRLKQTLSYSGGIANFNLNTKIYADTVEFRFEVNFWDNQTATTDSIADSVVCGDVYLIQGQSNAVASERDGQFEPYTVEWVRSYGMHTEKSGYDLYGQQSTAADTNWGLGQAAQQRTHAYIGIWGLRLGKLIAQTYGIPVCIINGAADGTPIDRHKRNSADPDALNTMYGRLLWRVTQAGLSNDVNAMIWWQGEGNTGNDAQAYDYYDEFPGIRDGWKTDYAGLQKIYTTQIHVGYGPSGGYLRSTQKYFAEIDDTTEIMTAHKLGEFTDGEHFYSSGYETYAQRIFAQISRDFYGNTDTVDVDPPNLTRAFFTNLSKNVLVLEFGNTDTLVWQNDTTVSGSPRYLKNYFYLHNSDESIDSNLVDTVMVFGNRLRLSLTQSSNAVEVTYLPDEYYNQTTTLYRGPWLQNSRGVPALSFYKFTIDIEFGDDPLPVSLTSFKAEIEGNAVKLSWRTESEVQNAGFILLRKTKTQTNYTEIASYEYVPALVGQGNTNQPTEYAYVDYVVTPGLTYSYLLQDVDYFGIKTNHGPIQITVLKKTIPTKVELFQNYPNPFNPYTHIRFFLPDDDRVSLSIYDVLGRKIATVYEGYLPAGYHDIKFEANSIQSGTYFYELRASDFSQRRKMTFIR